MATAQSPGTEVPVVLGPEPHKRPTLNVSSPLLELDVDKGL